MSGFGGILFTPQTANDPASFCHSDAAHEQQAGDAPALSPNGLLPPAFLLDHMSA